MLRRHIGLQTCDHSVEAVALIAVIGCWCEVLGALRPVRHAKRIESLRQHADHSIRSAVDVQRAANDRIVRAEAADPEIVRENQHGRRFETVFAWLKRPPEERRDAQRVEIICADARAPHHFRVAPVVQQELTVAVDGNAVERPRARHPLTHEPRVHDPCVGAIRVEERQRDDPIRRSEWELAQQQRFDDAKDRRIESDAERKRDDRGCRRTR